MNRGKGFAYIAAVLLLVVMAGMAATVISLNNTQRATANQDVLGIRAALAARAGIEWGLYQVKTPNSPACNSASDISNTLTDVDASFAVTVRCRRFQFNEGLDAGGAVQVKFLYRISATACNNSAVCPAAASVVAGADYVERRRLATVCGTANVNIDCY